MRVRAMIVDDEPLARQRLAVLLAEAEGVEVVAECSNGYEAIQAIREERPDLLFLDVQMPEVDGFQVLEAVGAGVVPVVVFVTAYDQFALRAFEAHAFDYLMKPFDDERFESTLARVRARLRERGGADLEERLKRLLREVREVGSDSPYLKRIGVRSGLRTVLVRTEEIDWVEAEGNYVRLHVGRSSHLLRETLSRLERVLDPERFTRIHRGTLVNVERIRSVEALFKGDQVVVLQDGTKLNAGRSYRQNLQRLIQPEG